MTITEFLLARIAEDESEAQAMRICEFYDGGWSDEHIDKVLAECEAKRRIVALDICMACAVEYQPCGHRDETLEILAAIYADHADFDPEWAPYSVG